MTTGYVLIVAILILGGVIATVGDRIGMKVGKARLTLFNLRPRQTATLVSVVTGSVISASTLGILFAVSSQLRRGVFDFEEVQADLRTAQAELQQVQQDRERIETELSQAQSQQKKAQQRLQEINESLNAAIARQQRTQDQLRQTQGQLQQVEQSYEQAQDQLESLAVQEQALQDEVEQLQTERQRLLQREQEIRAQIAEQDEEIAQRDRAIAQQRERLDTLRTEQAFLADQVEQLEREYRGLREGNVGLTRNQVLSRGIVDVEQPEAALAAVRQLLQEANRTALRNIVPNLPEQQIISISEEAVELLVRQISDEQEHVVQILSAENYLVGEPCVINEEDSRCIQVFWSAVPNELIFESGEVLGEVPVPLGGLNDQELVGRLNFLVTTSQFRANQAGVVTDDYQIADGREETIAEFLIQVQQYGQPVDLQAIAAQPIRAAGPLRIDLAAAQNGEILFRTRQTTLPDITPNRPPPGATFPDPGPPSSPPRRRS